jgi:hypothetical protein
MKFLLRAALTLSVILVFPGAPPPPAQGANFETGLGPALSGAFLNSAEAHADLARRYELAGEYGPANGEYQHVIDDATAALQPGTSDLQSATVHFVLGLAHADSARMLRYLQVQHLFADEYLAHLTRAGQELRASLALYQRQGLPVWQVYSALAVVQSLSGDLAGAQASVQQAQQHGEPNQGAEAALQRFATPPPAVAQAAAVMRKTPQKITIEQWSVIVTFGEELAGVLFPRYGGLVKAGIEVIKAFWPAQQ